MLGFFSFSIILGVSLIVGYYLFFYLKDKIRRRLMIWKLPKIEPSEKFFGHLRELMDTPENILKKKSRWCLQYYPLFAVCPGPLCAVNVCGPEDIEAVIASFRNLEKASVYHFLDSWLGEGLLTSTGKKWQTRRKILTPTFHFNILQQFLVVFNKESEKLVENIQTKGDGSVLDVLPLITDLTLTTINETAMGIKLDYTTKEDKQYKQAVYDIGKMYFDRFKKPWMYSDLLWYGTASGRKESRALKILHKFTKSVINNKSKTFEQFDEQIIDSDSYTKRKKMAMLDLLLNAQIKDGTIDKQGIVDEVNTFMFEGHDTTAMSLVFTLMLMACHPAAQDEIYSEIRQVMGDSEHHPTYSDLQELNYMERCIKESLRLYPSVPFIGRVTSEDIQSTKGIIPSGLSVLIHIIDLHRNPNVWPNPEKFDPDRFLPENCIKRHPFAFIPFSAGPRNCIGQKFALLEIKTLLCHILRKFELKPIDTPETVELMQDLVLRPAGQVRVKFELRNKK